MPGSLLRLAAGQMADEMLLCGQRVVPDKALALGFVFHHARIDAALAGMLGRTPPVRETRGASASFTEVAGDA